MKIKTVIAALCIGVALGVRAGGYETKTPERYVQCYNGEIQILPALTPQEIPNGHVSNVEAVGGFVFDLEWNENKVTHMRVLSKNGGVCRIRSHAGMYSPLMRKAEKECPNHAIAATKNRRRGADTPESAFERKKNPLFSMCYDFDTEKGELLEFTGVSGNQDWTDYAARMADAELRTPEAARIVRNVLDWQLETGGWPKNVPMHAKLTPRERQAVLARKGDKKTGTIDNQATISEMRFLARYYNVNRGEGAMAQAALAGVAKGLDFLLYMQYPNGGWPQCDPSKVGYWHQITYNDGAMVNAMKTLRDIFEAKPPFDLPLPDAKRTACRQAFDKGLECILKTQYMQNGKLTVWCQQHDRETLAPCIGRAFELPSLTSFESVDILYLLMSLDLSQYPDAFAKRVRAAIEGAVKWYEVTAMPGYKVEDNFRRPDGVLSRRLVHVPLAESTMWCRYYTLEDNRPFTGTRQSEKRFTFEDLERGENMDYMWFNTCGAQVKRAYEKWKAAGEGAGQGKNAAGKSQGATIDERNVTEWNGRHGSGGEQGLGPKQDSWGHAANWSKGRPAGNGVALFKKTAEIFSTRSGAYECGRIQLKNAKVALRAAGDDAAPRLHASEVEGKGMLILDGAGLEARQGETLVIPASVKIVAEHKGAKASAAGQTPVASWLSAGGAGGRLVVKGDVACTQGAVLRIGDGVTIEGKVVGAERFELAPGANVVNMPPPKPIVFRVANSQGLQSAKDNVAQTFHTVQEAFNAIPENTATPYVVKLAPGKYREKVRLGGRRARVTLVAEDPNPTKTVISWNDTPATLDAKGKPMGTFGCWTFYVDTPDFTMEGITVENTGTPERLAATGGKEQAGQCVALFTRGDRNVFRNCRLLGWQDTLYAGGKVGFSSVRQYYENCYIEGAVDFIFGDAIALFSKCHLHSVNGGYVTAGSHSFDEPFGYVFIDCTVTCVSGKTTYLGRPWRPYANITWVNSDFGSAVCPEGWRDWTEACGTRVWRSAEYGCTHKGQAKRDKIVTVGSLEDFRKRLAAAGLSKPSDIIAGADDWRPATKSGK